MGEVSTIGLDLAKSVFQVHGADASGAVLFSQEAAAAPGPRVLLVSATLHGGDGGLRQHPSLGTRDQPAWSCRSADPTGLREDAMRR